MSLRLAMFALLLTLAASAAHAAAPVEASGAVGGWTLAWVIGLLSGVALMVFTTFDWRNLPALALMWLRLQRRNAGWAMLSAASLAVIGFYGL